jgi:hypothetical protein
MLNSKLYDSEQSVGLCKNLLQSRGPVAALVLTIPCNSRYFNRKVRIFVHARSNMRPTGVGVW